MTQLLYLTIRGDFFQNLTIRVYIELTSKQKCLITVEKVSDDILLGVVISVYHGKKVLYLRR